MDGEEMNGKKEENGKDDKREVEMRIEWSMSEVSAILSLQLTTGLPACFSCQFSTCVPEPWRHMSGDEARNRSAEAAKNSSVHPVNRPPSSTSETGVASISQPLHSLPRGAFSHTAETGSQRPALPGLHLQTRVTGEGERGPASTRPRIDTQIRMDSLLLWIGFD